MEQMWRDFILVKNIRKNSRDKGVILPLVLLLISILMWSFSFFLFFYKSEIDEFQALKRSNDDYWEMENISIIAEYELSKGNENIKKDIYRDIIEYFEDHDLIWIEPNKISKSGYKRYKVIRNNSEITGKVELNLGTDNILDITLLKEIWIENKLIEIIVKINYEYLRYDGDFYNSYKRGVDRIEARVKYENVRNK